MVRWRYAGVQYEYSIRGRTYVIKARHIIRGSQERNVLTISLKLALYSFTDNCRTMLFKLWTRVNFKTQVNNRIAWCNMVRIKHVYEDKSKVRVVYLEVAAFLHRDTKLILLGPRTT